MNFIFGFGMRRQSGEGDCNVNDKSLRQLISEKKTRSVARSDQEGQQMVEFAFTFIIFCILLAAIALFGWVFFVQLSMNHGAKEGSRHLMRHATVPEDQDNFASADAEARFVVTNSMPLLDWTAMTVTFSPSQGDRVPEGWVAVDIWYDVPLPTIRFPLGFTDDVITVMQPLRLRTRSVRHLQ